MTPLDPSLWVEKYRPSSWETVVLEPSHRDLFDALHAAHECPSLLAYGPPGTGKTTTLLQWIEHFQPGSYPRQVLILNASADRSVATLRERVLPFVQSASWSFASPPWWKFVVLDEADSLPPDSQQLIAQWIRDLRPTRNRFLLMCNYLDRLDSRLVHSLVCLRFRQLPSDQIDALLQRVARTEHLAWSDSDLRAVRRQFQPDVRRMITCLQTHAWSSTWTFVRPTEWDAWHAAFVSASSPERDLLLRDACASRGLSLRQWMSQYLSFWVRYHPSSLTPAHLELFQRLASWTPDSEEIARHYVLSQWEALSSARPL
jgi:DNA polymerase III delta prime subunit